MTGYGAGERVYKCSAIKGRVSRCNVIARPHPVGDRMIVSDYVVAIERPSIKFPVLRVEIPCSAKIIPCFAE